jgi:osmotically-inducible protein OsmY
MTDDNLIKDVERTLAFDTRVDHTAITIDSDETGTIILNGHVDTYNEKELVEQVTGRVRGVKDIENNITVVPPMPKADYEITENVRKNLELDTWVDHTKINAETIDSVVFIRGTVGSMVEKQEAENDARWVAGVVDVVNHLTVKPEFEVEDSEIMRDIRAALLKNTRVDLTEMGVDVTDGVATLTGGVGNFTQKRIAEFVTFAVPGVVDVVNELHLLGKQRRVA